MVSIGVLPDPLPTFISSMSRTVRVRGYLILNHTVYLSLPVFPRRSVSFSGWGLPSQAREAVVPSVALRNPLFWTEISNVNLGKCCSHSVQRSHILGLRFPDLVEEVVKVVSRTRRFRIVNQDASGSSGLCQGKKKTTWGNNRKLLRRRQSRFFGSGVEKKTIIVVWSQFRSR